MLRVKNTFIKCSEAVLRLITSHTLEIVNTHFEILKLTTYFLKFVVNINGIIWTIRIDICLRNGLRSYSLNQS